MPLLSKWKFFQITADATNIVANDQVLGDLGKGTYKITAIADVADATITISDGKTNVLDAAPIPIRAASVTYPQMLRSQDYAWTVNYQGSAAAIPIDIIDGTGGDIVVKVEKVN
jgi:hypothetical protein